MNYYFVFIFITHIFLAGKRTVIITKHLEATVLYLPFITIFSHVLFLNSFITLQSVNMLQKGLIFHPEDCVGLFFASSTHRPQNPTAACEVFTKDAMNHHVNSSYFDHTVEAVSCKVAVPNEQYFSSSSKMFRLRFLQ